jgi:hypothetical protein
MSKEHFSKIRSLMHTYSRSTIAEGQEFIDQATARSGHRVNINEVRSDIYPMISSIEERDTYFLTTNNEGVRVVGGKVGSQFTKVIQFLDKVKLQEIPNTNGESYRVIDKDGNALQNFIDPADKPINDVKLSDGYEIKLFANDGETIIPRNYGWEFDSFNGILHFDSKFKPGSIDWNALKFGTPLLEGFIYIGESTLDVVQNLKTENENNQKAIEKAVENALAIQPFKFTTKEMHKVDEPYKAPYNHLEGDDQEYFQQLSFIVPGYCFELTSLDNDQTFITELRHLPNGDTQIFLDLPWNIDYDQPILYYEWASGINGLGNKIPVIGKYKFIATTFVKSNGKKITVKELIDYEGKYSEVIQPQEDYRFSTEYEAGWPVPGKNINTNSYYANDDNGNLNVNIND